MKNPIKKYLNNYIIKKIKLRDEALEKAFKELDLESMYTTPKDKVLIRLLKDTFHLGFLQGESFKMKQELERTKFYITLYIAMFGAFIVADLLIF